MVEQFFIELIRDTGYFGVFLSSLIGSATIVFPAPSFVLIITSGAFLNPVVVALAAALGSALGEFTGYLVGYEGKKLLQNKVHLEKPAYKKWLDKISRLAGTYKMPFVIFAFALLPLPFDFVGIFCGTIRYDAKKFFVATLLGKLGKSLILAYAGFFGLHWIMDYFI